jgi:hypothetical protein
MGELIFIDVAKREKDLTVQDAWDAYLVAREKVETSRDVMDAIAAGKAWRRFLDLFDPMRRA